MGINIEFVKGETYNLHYKPSGKTKRPKTIIKKCNIVQICEKFIVVNLGNYRETIMKDDLMNGQVSLLPA